MSWAGKQSLKDYFRSLFPKREQAPSSFCPPPEPKQLSPEEEERVARALDAWVQAKGYRLPHKTLAETAENIGLPYPIIYRYFLAQGDDLRAFRTRLRLQDAMEQMKAEPETSISTISRRVGISDRSNFAHSFKQLTGLTPDEWRKK
jgi:AraC-like DNA-binding protein